MGLKPRKNMASFFDKPEAEEGQVEEGQEQGLSPEELAAEEAEEAEEARRKYHEAGITRVQLQDEVWQNIERAAKTIKGAKAKACQTAQAGVEGGKEALNAGKSALQKLEAGRQKFKKAFWRGLG